MEIQILIVEIVILISVIQFSFNFSYLEFSEFSFFSLINYFFNSVKFMENLNF